ncbi:30S ribosomal protein S2 [Candidatus Roizmanbacteria bacterium RIFCSPHIGHO2_02_FULL_40_9]|uniref:Small ribosomal subunit protein uS2 n=2 Tax=Candidatus Roizmaniibacteriota TaxID=1752723 RepID=A0A1F7IMF1_9BACT|nr:MAG: 30S ribosomal protein S2 [Candidatus Roizmanbacteria bacterium RIFCSPHIGHO2_02_FULL_40_9]OGK44512.1 MAG: 30S ribosomal protein S2 [Candidatus Roizmanbacteria bacterium RIFCSPLOWO2_01_FULL_38_11]
MEKSDPAVLLSYGLHLGHTKQKLHPKAKKYVYKIEKGIAIIDLFQSASFFDKAKEHLSELGKQGKIVLFVATKKSAKDTVRELCKENNIPYMTSKWVGGFLTNINEIFKNIKKMNQMREDRDSGVWDKLPKHERVALSKKLNRIASIYVGVEHLDKLPDALFIIDIKKESNALKEALQTGIETIAVVDTNVNPDDVNYPIPANDDAVLSVKYIAEQAVKAYMTNFTPQSEKVNEATASIADMKNEEKIEAETKKIKETPTKEKVIKKKKVQKK